jgi:glutathione synthase/RimK-type ligase-like ATP-grasp enzyme
MPRIVADYCKRAGIDLQTFSDDWVLRLARDGVTKWAVGYRFDVNGAAAADLAQDKVATYLVLNAAGVDVVPHFLVRVLPEETIYGGGLRQTLGGGPVVAKPLDGMGGRNVGRFDTVDDALEMIHASDETAWALSPYRELQAEYRLLMLNGNLLLAFEKTQPQLYEGLKLFNLGAGAVPADIDKEILEQLLPIAERAVEATSLRLAAVDIVRQADGTLCVLEVNCGISLEHYGRQSAEYEARAVAAYESIIEAMFQ